MLHMQSGAALDLQVVRAFVLLCLTFVVSIRVNGSLHRIPTQTVLILLVPTLLTLRLKARAVVSYFAFAALTILHLIWLDCSDRLPFSISDVLKDYMQYIALLGLYITFFSKLTWQALEGPAVVFFKSQTLIGLALWVLAVGTGGSYGVDISYAIPRLQSLVTEPSNISHFLPAFLIFCFRQRWWRWSGICAGAILCTFSPTVYLTLLATGALLWMLTARPLSVLGTVLFSLVAVTLILDNYATLLATLSEAGQLGQAAARVLEGFTFIASDGEIGANSRAELIFSGIEFMNTYNLWWSGAGFGTSAYIGDVYNDGLLFDSNTWSSLVIWFGALAVPVWLFAQYLSVRKRDKSFMYILLVSMCVSNTLNAGGVWIQMFFATLIYLKLKRDLSTAI
jgi:hypothetical protein